MKKKKKKKKKIKMFKKLKKKLKKLLPKSLSYSCLLNDTFVIPCLFNQYEKYHW